MFLSLLLQTAAAATTVVNNEPLLPKMGVELLVMLASDIGIIWAIVTWKIKRSDDAALAAAKEKEEAVRVAEEKHKKLAVEVANQHNMLMEQQRAFDKAKAEADAKHEKTRLQVQALKPLPGKVASLEAKFEVIGVQMTALKEDVREIKSDIKSNNSELRGDIKSLLALVQSNQTQH